MGLCDTPQALVLFVLILIIICVLFKGPYHVILIDVVSLSYYAPRFFLMLGLLYGTFAQQGCIPSAGCLPTLQCPIGSLYCSNVALADSTIDFSGVQGQRGWYFGWRNVSIPFTAYLNWHTNNTWPTCPQGMWYTDPYQQPSVCAAGAHPVVRNGVKATVRRFLATTSMQVTATGAFANTQLNGTPNCITADGTTAYIRHNGAIQWTRNDNTRTGVLVPYSVVVSLLPGDTLDFEIWPNSNSICDYSIFTVVLTGLCASNTCENIICNYSALPCFCAPPWSGSDCSLIPTTIYTVNQSTPVRWLHSFS